MLNLKKKDNSEEINKEKETPSKAHKKGNLFTLKKKDEKEEAKTEEPTLDDKLEKVANDKIAQTKFSTRMAGVFNKMYRLILSVSLQQNVCQIESGSKYIFETLFPDRFFYTELINIFSQHVHPDSKERFLHDFEPKNLCEALSNDVNGFVSCYSFAEPDIVNDDGSVTRNILYYEFRADRIPDNAELQTRCIIYIREISAVKYEEYLARNFGNYEKYDIYKDLNEIRMTSFFESDNVIYFEYDIESDILYLHDGLENDVEPTVVKNYLRNIESRSDWTLFHADVKTIQRGFKDAVAGEKIDTEIKYRKNGDKNKAFRFCTFSVTPAIEIGEKKWLIGNIKDIDDEIRQRNASHDIGSHMDSMMGSIFSSIYEIDFDKDLMYHVKYTDDGFIKEDKAVSFSQTVIGEINGGKLDENTVSEYKKWLEPGFLEHSTIKGNYEFESCATDIATGNPKYYQETISKLTGQRRFLRVKRDITDIQNARQAEYKAREETRFLEYNRQMLDLMASLVEFRNVESGTHIEKVRELVKILLQDLAYRSPLYDITPRMIDLYTEAATLHDIGKIVVPDSILNKQGKYTPEEFNIMKRHTVDGEKIVEKLILPGQEELLKCCKQVTRHHHERFDGKGYPDGLVGDDIPIGVQAMGLADAYDALVSVRCYKDGFSHEEAVRMIMDGECGAFNPRLLETFTHCKDKMLKLYV